MGGRRSAQSKRAGLSTRGCILKVKNETTGEWEKVNNENFPANGVTIVLPYPEGTNSSNFRKFLS